MKLKIMSTMLMFAMACTVSALAQTDKDSAKSDKKMGGEKTVTGCVMEHDGNYMVMDKKHHNVKLSTTEDLKPHVGHEMSFTGTMSKMSGGEMKSDDKMAASDKSMKHEHGGMEMQVSSMKMVSEKCEAGMAKDSGGMDKK